MGAALSSGTPTEASAVPEESISSLDDLTEELVKLSTSSETETGENSTSDSHRGADDGDVARGDAYESNSEETQEERLVRKQAEMDAFYSEVVNKREARNKALGDIAKKLRRMEKMEEELEKEREEKQTLELHCKALKEVNKITKEMLRIRETQVTDLKTRLNDVEKKLEESPEEIKIEYEKQMSNYKKLRELYEQRAVAAELEHKTMIEKELAKNALLEAKLKEIQEEIQAQLEKYKENKRQILEMEKNIEAKDDEINNLNESLTSSLAENHILNSQMTLVNNLFSNMLINPMINLDMLIKLIQDNYLLIIDLINNHEINDTVSLLVDLEKKIDQETLEIHNRKQMKQLEEGEGACCSDETDENAETENGTLDKSHIQKEIANNLPKVWRILIELLNTHQEQYENNEINENFDSCYKNVQTNSGKTQQVISVSQTFIRLKHLILEKNHLTNQLVKLKTLNNHLEIRLNQSEQRLNTVTSELKKTWNVVNKLKLQHKQLYTHEKILKYELKHKRNIINDLKVDLEYVREKWDLVKEKNEQNELDYKLLRKEFALRRLQYDGGRSTSESGISTDTEDDNVEIVETNDESEDDKSEVVETQSEHDVPRTNSVMSIEEDDQDEVEELENETNVNENREDVTSEFVIEPIVAERGSTNVLDLSLRVEVPETIVLESTLETSEPEVSSLPSAYSSRPERASNNSYSEEVNSRLTPDIPEDPESEARSEENLSQIILNKKVTVKTIGGKIKIVTELLPNEASTSESNESIAETVVQTKIKSDPSVSPKRTVTFSIQDSVVENKDISIENQTSSQSVPEPSEEQRPKLLTRQDRIAEDTILPVVEESSTSQPRTTDSQNRRLSNESSEELVNTVQSKVDDLKRVLLARRKSSLISQKSSPTTHEENSEETETKLNRNIRNTNADHSNQVESEAAVAENIPPTLPKTETRIPVESSHRSVPESIAQPASSSSETSSRSLSSSSEPSPSFARTRTPEEILEARNARLKRLEDQTKNLFHKMSLTSQRSETLSERLVELHEYYGSSNERSDRSPRRQRENSNDSDETRLKPIEQEEARSIPDSSVTENKESNDDTSEKSEGESEGCNASGDSQSGPV